MHLALLFQKCLTLFYTSLSVYNEKTVDLALQENYRECSSFFRRNSISYTCQPLLFSLFLSFSFSYSFASILERIYRKICISIASIGALVNASAFHGRSATFWTYFPLPSHFIFHRYYFPMMQKSFISQNKLIGVS